ncbi:MAG: COX15/CtaA family protein [Planctomycetes bacterium]|nr:COX15/CtaA family protein [Planctomycetota bacterium]
MERTPGSRSIHAWLIVTFGLIGVMVAVGGATRLTGSGLSMVEWSPLGSSPPSTESDWEALYAEYQASPQFQQVNHWMTADDFKGIFWWEYVHRQLGRLIGLVYGLPFLWFLIRGRLCRELVWRGWVGLGLGGLQGLVGWWMVKSGLVSRPEVSHYRLALHLSLALLAGMWVLWMWLGTRSAQGRGALASSRVPWTFTALVSLQIIWGAFMAGKRAGWRYDTWPDMDGAFLPDGALGSVDALVEDGDTVHWVHRTLGWVVLASAVWLWARLRRTARGPANAVLVLTLLQFVLGVATVMAGIPVTLGVAHQVGAFFLLSAAIWGAHSCSRRPRSSAL